MTPPLKSFLVVINKKWARILNRIHRRTQKALNLLKTRPTDLDTFLDCQTVFIRFSVQRYYIVGLAFFPITTFINVDDHHHPPKKRVVTNIFQFVFDFSHFGQKLRKYTGWHIAKSFE